MMLPNGDRAFVDMRKLRDYCLNPNHLEGANKARVFASALGITARQADRLKDALLEAAKTQEATLTGLDEYGARYVIDFWMDGLRKPVKVRSGWIIRKGEDFPRLTTCYVS